MLYTFCYKDRLGLCKDLDQKIKNKGKGAFLKQIACYLMKSYHIFSYIYVNQINLFVSRSLISLTNVVKGLSHILK